MSEYQKIYFAKRADGLVKIGCTKNLKSRLASLAISHGPLDVLKTVNGSRRREKSLHSHFKDHAEFGEWFRDSEAFRERMAAVPEGDIEQIKKSKENEAWARRELEVCLRVQGDLQDLVNILRSNGMGQDEALRFLTGTYHLPHWSIRHIYCGRAITVSAAMAEAVRGALDAEISALAAKVQRAKQALSA